MSQPFTPLQSEIRSSEVQHQRGREYDPEALLRMGGLLMNVAIGLEELAKRCRYSGCNEDDEMYYMRYEQSFAEKIGESSDSIVYMDVDLTVGTKADPEDPTAAPLAQEFLLSITTSDVDGETLIEDDFLLEAEAGRGTTLCVRKGIEGVAEALRQEDPLFESARRWHAATLYEAAELPMEIARLISLPLEESGEVV